MKTDIMNSVGRSLHKVGFKFKKHSPEILIVTGVVGIIASTVIACKATNKVNDIVDETNEIIDTNHDTTGKAMKKRVVNEKT